MRIGEIFREGRRALTAVLLLSGILSFTALAEGGYYVDSAPIRFHVTHSADAPEPESYRVHLEADSATPLAPMPEETTLTLPVKPGETVSELFGNIRYTKPGLYSYLLYEESGSTANVVYDKTRYIVTVEVRNTQSGAESPLVAEFITCVIEGDDKKQPDPPFRNGYQKPEETKPAPPPGNGGGGGGGGNPGWRRVDVPPSEDGGPGLLGQVLGAVRENPAVEAVSRIPQVLGAARNRIATGDESLLAVYLSIAVLSLAGLGIWIFESRRRKEV